MPSNPLFISNPPSYQERWGGHAAGRGRVLPGPLPLVLAHLSSLTRLEYGAALEGLTRGRPSTSSPAVLHWFSVAHLGVVVRYLGEARKIWVESDSSIQVGSAHGRCTPQDLTAAIIMAAGVSSTHLTWLLFECFLYPQSGEAAGLRARPGR